MNRQRPGYAVVWPVLAVIVGVLLVQKAAVGTATHETESAASGVAVAGGQQGGTVGSPRRVVFVAGTRSHGYGAHDHWAGSLLLSRMLNEQHPDIDAVVYRDGWPSDAAAFDGASTIVIYANGGPRHPAVSHLEALGVLMDKGVGLVLLHYAVEVEEATAGQQLLDWVGGYFKVHWSVNPHWVLRGPTLPDHPITRGVRPYEIYDEWYYHMQFREGMRGVTPILSALPPETSLARPDGPHSGNPHARAAVLERREVQPVAWAAERAGGGRGFGFTGGHEHWNCGHPMQRKLVLNAIAWTAHADVPERGIETPPVSVEDLEANPEEDVPAAWLGPPPADGGPGIRSRAQLFDRLVQWHREFPPVR